MLSGNANISGNTLNNVLYSGTGNNILNGGAGQDTVSYANSGSGVRVGLSVTTAQATLGSGSDTLISIENLIGSNFGDTLTGNAGANAINAGAGADVLTGGAGNDTLTGGSGDDTFIFDAAKGNSNIDTLTDFKVSGSDKIVLDDDIFTALGAVGTTSGVALKAGTFQLGTAANDAGDRIIYDQTSGKLYYDADGTGASAQVQIALIGTTAHATLAASDFLVIA